VRSGDEPAHARSALRPRMWLAAFGFVDAVAGVIVFTVLGSMPFVIVSVVLGVVSGINLIVVARHIGQGPHYQPGPTIPPYRPVHDESSAERAEPRALTPVRTRRRRYVAMMGTCLVLIVLAWTWVHIYSITAALLMTLVAALIPPIAAIITNADSPILRGGDGSEGGGDGGDDPAEGPGDAAADNETLARKRDREERDS
jgi:Family of unknown function (DUF6343)/Protein of unknown function (DUF3099)